MTGTEKIDLSISNSWEETLKVAFQKLRRTPFVVEDTFSFGNLDITTTSTMTLTAIVTNLSRYLKLGKFLFLSVNISLTAGGVASNLITLTIPYTFPTTGDQSIAGYVLPGAITAIGLVKAVAGSNRLEIYQDNLTNYTLGAVTIQFNGFFEVL